MNGLCAIDLTRLEEGEIEKHELVKLDLNSYNPVWSINKQMITVKNFDENNIYILPNSSIG